MSNGAVIYRGPSTLPGQRKRPIVAILTGLIRPSANRKTGPMIQLWILPADAHPVEAVQGGTDGGVCGGCPLKGEGGEDRACYVNLMGPSTVYKAWNAGQYADWTRGLPRGYRLPYAVRLGAWGDPVAVPYRVIRRLLKATPGGWTGYTHQWRTAAPGWARILMASVESLEDRAEAVREGWRTFRMHKGGAPERGEIVCPASAEAGHRTVCMVCKLCQGTTSGSKVGIVIQVHGPGSYRYQGGQS